MWPMYIQHEWLMAKFDPIVVTPSATQLDHLGPAFEHVKTVSNGLSRPEHEINYLKPLFVWKSYQV